MLQNEGEVGGGGGGHEILFFLKGGNRRVSDVCCGEQKIFMNLNPIPGAPPVVKNDTSLTCEKWDLASVGPPRHSL